MWTPSRAMSRRAGRRKRGRRKPRHLRQSWLLRLQRRPPPPPTHAETSPTTPLRHSKICMSPRTPVMDEGRPRQALAVSQVTSWGTPEMAIRAAPQGVCADCTPDRGPDRASPCIPSPDDADVLVLESPGQKAFLESLQLSPGMFASPGRTLLSPLVLPEVESDVFAVLCLDSPVTPPSPSTWIELLDSLEEEIDLVQ